MARKPKMKIVSHFDRARIAGDEAVYLALKHALNEGEETGQKKIATQAARRDYNLTPSSLQSHLGPREAVLSLDEWWWRFFEFGTVYIPAMPSLRPAHSKAKRVLKEDLGANFEGFIRKRAAVRKT